MKDGKQVRLLVCGGRDYTDKAKIYNVLDILHEDYDVDVLIDGAARGADSFASQWAKDRGIENLRFPADWKAHGRCAGPKRNRRMLEEGTPGMFVAFGGGRGTQNMIEQAQDWGISGWAFD